MLKAAFLTQKIRWLTAAMILCATAFCSMLIAPDGHTQAPASTTSNVAINALLAQLKTQQDQMAANQTKIEAQTAQLQEELRQAKIFSARSGSGHR